MKHDDLCMSQDSDPCIICDLIARVRRDERDVIEGDSELDIEEIKAIAFDRGHEEGTKQSIVNTPTEDVLLNDMKKYILERMTTMTLAETNSLYAMYSHLGGK